MIVTASIIVILEVSLWVLTLLVMGINSVWEYYQKHRRWWE